MVDHMELAGRAAELMQRGETFRVELAAVADFLNDTAAFGRDVNELARRNDCGNAQHLESTMRSVDDETGWTPLFTLLDELHLDDALDIYGKVHA
ncbi:MAG: hypothetical protein QOD92_3655 [Acidimicrobiaceae bacterium]|jgi:hypothetical protein